MVAMDLLLPNSHNLAILSAVLFLCLSVDTNNLLAGKSSCVTLKYVFAWMYLVENSFSLIRDGVIDCNSSSKSPMMDHDGVNFFTDAFSNLMS